MKGTRMRFKNAEQYLESRNELFMKNITLSLLLSSESSAEKTF